uniref:Uncharacterized protein n=2 Tax=Graphocephala atropunctata TaxID=36148 RepID=A0A1B6MR42_9HEMI
MPPETSAVLFEEKPKSYGTVITSNMEEGTKAKKSIVNQVFLCCLANSALLGSGMSLGFTAVALPYMLEPDSLVPIDDIQASWIDCQWSYNVYGLRYQLLCAQDVPLHEGSAGQAWSVLLFRHNGVSWHALCYLFPA